jgi:hypothetical protein
MLLAPKSHLESGRETDRVELGFDIGRQEAIARGGIDQERIADR